MLSYYFIDGKKINHTPYPYDRYVQHPGKLDKDNYVTIGGHGFYVKNQYRSCSKPAGWDDMPVYPDSPLDKYALVPNINGPDLNSPARFYECRSQKGTLT